ncbi:MAG TPA: hypothetical protein VGX25_32775 [Actinophytocola sp.]|uniref:hypothetical protein n=1 Tax=Actinophytocola sp. TaxID=1872138 RepID=UPI002DDD2F57|nr:hypothetical protein [Actinophytocola sp.]HEV2784185.1 hypothetical protein [Actinophytocola sp.]
MPITTLTAVVAAAVAPLVADRARRWIAIPSVVRRGIVFRLFLDTGDPREAKVAESKLDAIGFGFLVPFFFVISGVRFELTALVTDLGALLLLPAFLALLIVPRGAAVPAGQHGPE